MLKFIGRRILHTIPLIIAVTLVVFILVDAMPGDEMTAYINSLPEGDPRPTQEQYQQIRRVLELDKPWHLRYFDWLSDAAKGDFGTSFYYRRPAIEVVNNLIWHTFMINAIAMFLVFLIAIPLGVRAAAKKNGPFDRVVSTTTLIFVSLPSFFIGLYLMRLFAVDFGLFPATGMHSVISLVKGYATKADEIKDVLLHMALPVMTLTVIGIGTVSRYVRNAVIEVINQDYIRTARSKGLTERLVIYRHAFRNAWIPIISLLGVMLPTLFVGNIFVEAIFAWPGIGLEFLYAVYRRDGAMITVIILFFSVASVAGNLMADILYGVADPRIKIE
jgi:peptide/nickel transport system permease protein